jgi:glycosyltransferase involved in cell wall biosynthesis
MLRHYDQHMGGVRVYTRKLLEAMLGLGSGHEFVFLYRNSALVGTHGGDPQVREVALPARSFLGWDQVAVPRAAKQYGLNLIFNPKYSIPLAAPCPAVWVCHGLDWYVMPWASKFVDRLSHRLLVPRYAAKAAGIVAVSEITRQHVMQYLPVPPERVFTVYSGVDDVFRRPVDEARLAAARSRYSLPPRFVLYAGAVYPPKNFTRLVQAYARVGPERGVPLVIAGGENRFLSEHELKEPERLGIGRSTGARRLLCHGRRPAAAVAVRVVRVAGPGGDGGRLPGRDRGSLRNQGAGRWGRGPGEPGERGEHRRWNTARARRRRPPGAADRGRPGSEP